MRTAWHIDRKRALQAAGPFVVAAVAAAGVGAGGAPAGVPGPAAGFVVTVAFIAGLLGGWLGVSGAAAGAAVGGSIGSLAALGPSDAVLAGLAWAVTAALAAAVPFAVFRLVPGVGRGLASLRSYLWLLASGILAAVLSAAVRWAALGGGPFLALWAVAFAGVVGISFVAPLAAMAADLWGRRWMAPLPGETPSRRLVSLADARVPSLASGDETRLLVARRPHLGLGIGAGLLALAAVTLAVVPITEVLSEGGYWILLAYLVPILWSGARYGLRGAVATGAAAGLLFVAGHAAWSAVVADPALTLSLADLGAACTELVLFGLVGAVTGTAREREELLRMDVVHRNRLLRQDLLRVVQALTSAVEAKDVYTEGHLRRVSDFAVMVGEAMGVRGHDLEMIFFGSMLHDIGKIGVPEAILAKQGPLSLEESRAMRGHAEIGARILQDLDVLRDAAPIVLHHQERWDGRRDGTYPGYPVGLRGESIPLGSRIIAVVDAFDAMTTDRPYRKALSAEAALEELRKEAGKQFDPRVVEAFGTLLAERPWTPRGGA